MTTHETREKLIESAIELVLTSGYHATGVQEICNHAGVRKGSFYHFFPSKRDLILEALDRQWARQTHLLLDPVFNDAIPPLDRIVNMFERMAEHQTHLQQNYGRVYGCPFGTLAQELSTHDDLLRLKLVSIFQAWTVYIEGALSAAIVAGDLPPTVPVQPTAQSILAYLQGVMLMAKTHNDPAWIQRFAESVRTLALNAA